jgi:hypothetical protein
MSTATYDLYAAEAAWREGRPNPTDAIVGRRAIFTTYEGERMEGTVEPPLTGPCSTGRFPIVRFADGRWARLDSLIEIVNA